MRILLVEDDKKVAGSKVTVHYVVENNQSVATMVKAELAKVASKKKS